MSGVVQCVDVSSCGNFCVIGYSSGHVDVFNMQSGIHRGSYVNPHSHTGTSATSINPFVSSSYCCLLSMFLLCLRLREISSSEHHVMDNLTLQTCLS